MAKTEEIKIKFSNINIDNFIDYITRSNIKEKQVIDICKTKLCSKGHDLNKTFVKYTEINIDDIFGSISLPETFKDTTIIMLPFNDLKKVLEMAKIYKLSNKGQINGEITCKYDEEQDRYIGLILQFKSATLTTKINLGEITMIQYLPTNIWERISSLDNNILEFKLHDDERDELIKLLKFESEVVKNQIKEIKKFLIEITNSNVLFKSFEGKWETKYDIVSNSGMQPITLVVSSVMVEKMESGKNYNMNFISYNGNVCLIASEIGSATKFLTASQKYDKNMK